MKTLPRLLLLCLFVAFALSCMTSIAFGAGRLVLDDEFNSSFNSGVWTKTDPWYLDHGTDDLEYFNPANVTVADGCLDMRAEKRAANDHDYQSGIVSSLNHAQFLYGYFEIRAKLPTGAGLWPTFWLVGKNSEIDGFEVPNDVPGRLYMTYHEGDSQVYQGHADGSWGSDFHTYGIDWQPTYVKWYIDGRQVASYNHATPVDPQTLCMSTIVGGRWSGPPTSATKFPNDFLVDYLRVYDTKPSGVTVPIAANDAYSVNESSTLRAAAPGVLGNDVATDRGKLTPSVVNWPTHGDLSLSPDGSFTYAPTPGYAGTDSFTYTDSDGATTSGAATVALNVVDPNASVPTVVTKPTVKAKSRRTFKIAGGLHFGRRGLQATTASNDTRPALLTIQIQRKHKDGKWHAYKTVRWTNPPSSYVSTIGLCSGTFQVRSSLSGGNVPNGQSGWTKSFRVE